MIRPLTRRDFLRTAAAAALAPALPAWGPAPRARSFSFAFFSDTHVALTRNAHECRALLRELAGVVRPAFAVNGGDVTDYGWQGEYENYRWVLHGLRFPVHHVPGSRERWMAATGAEIYDSSPVVADGHVAIGSVNGTLSLIDADTGAIRARYRLPPGHFLSSPAAGDGWIHAAAFSDVVVAFSVEELRFCGEGTGRMGVTLDVGDP
jgi:hypothetical protein